MGSYHLCDVSLKNDSFFINIHELLQNIIMYGIVRRGFWGENVAKALPQKAKQPRDWKRLEGGM